MLNIKLTLNTYIKIDFFKFYIQLLVVNILI